MACRMSSISGTALFPRHHRGTWRGLSTSYATRPTAHDPVAEGAACRGRHLLDGGAALPAAAVRLSQRGRARLQAERDVQGHGAAAAAADYEPGHDRGVDHGAAAGLADGRAPR